MARPRKHAAASVQQEHAAEVVRAQQAGRQVVGPTGQPEPGSLAPPPNELGHLQYDADGRLTRDGMLSALSSGYTVLHHTRRPDGGVAAGHIRDAGGVPSEVELAGDNEESLERAREGLEARQADLDRQKRLLDSRSKSGQERRKAAEKSDKGRTPPPEVRTTNDDGSPRVSGAVPPTTEYAGTGDPEAYAAEQEKQTNAQHAARQKRGK